MRHRCNEIVTRTDTGKSVRIGQDDTSKYFFEFDDLDARVALTGAPRRPEAWQSLAESNRSSQNENLVS